MRAILYRRVSTDEQASSGLGLDAQAALLQAEADRRGFTDVVWLTDEGYSAGNLKRPAIQQALEALACRRADALVVAKLDRLSRSLLDFAALMDRGRREGWAMIALDLGVDTTTPAGEMMANVMASFAQYERRLISQRTSDAMQAAKRRGRRFSAHMVNQPPEVRELAYRLRGEGQSLRSIADQLNAASVPTSQGGREWYASSVSALLRSVELDRSTATASPR